jgi:hypothetical protein
MKKLTVIGAILLGAGQPQNPAREPSHVGPPRDGVVIISAFCIVLLDNVPKSNRVLTRTAIRRRVRHDARGLSRGVQSP